MKHARCILTMIITLALYVSAPAQSSQEADFSEFSIISARNIFNSERRAARQRMAEPSETTTPDEFRLIGILITDWSSLVFFESTQPEYKGLRKTGDHIAGFAIRNIRTDGLTLEKGGIRHEMPVTAVMRRNEADAWELVDSSSWTRATTGPPSQEQTADEGPDSGSDVLKKLMERRRLEGNQ